MLIVISLHTSYSPSSTPPPRINIILTIRDRLHVRSRTQHEKYVTKMYSYPHVLCVITDDPLVRITGIRETKYVKRHVSHTLKTFVCRTASYVTHTCVNTPPTCALGRRWNANRHTPFCTVYLYYIYIQVHFFIYTSYIYIYILYTTSSCMSYPSSKTFSNAPFLPTHTQYVIRGTSPNVTFRTHVS